MKLGLACNWPAQAGLELSIFLPQLPECCDYGNNSPGPAKKLYFEFQLKFK
jgi:hypothetical protein